MPPYFRNLRERDVVSAYLRLGFRRAGSAEGRMRDLSTLDWD